MITFEIDRASNGQYFARIKARNGKTLFTSETYKRKRDAKHACDLIRQGEPWWSDLRDLTK